ncbi:MAG: NYN domain-containing protein [Candidatus Kaelpia aquatica]|nr:NYN domain-containing protein [Candidatus Kaelpia aquatica]
MFYLLDGYNILRRMQDLYPGVVGESRESLAGFLSRYKPQGKNGAIVFFDGYGNMSNSYGKIEILFSKDISADEHILEFLKKNQKQKDYYLVTDDRDLGFKARNFDARVISVADFVGTIFKKKRKTREESGDKISPFSSQAYEINKELEDLWLKRKRNTG